MNNQNQDNTPASDLIVTEKDIRKALNYAGIKVDPDTWHINRLRNEIARQQKELDKILNRNIIQPTQTKPL